MKLEEYQTAKAALEKGASMAPNDSRFVNLIKDCDQCIAGMQLMSATFSFYLFVILCIFNILRNYFLAFIDAYFSEEAGDLQTHVSENAPSNEAYPEDVQPAVNPSNQVTTAAAAKPKYRLVVIFFRFCVYLNVRFGLWDAKFSNILAFVVDIPFVVLFIVFTFRMKLVHC